MNRKYGSWSICHFLCVDYECTPCERLYTFKGALHKHCRNASRHVWRERCCRAFIRVHPRMHTSERLAGIIIIIFIKLFIHASVSPVDLIFAYDVRHRKISRLVPSLRITALHNSINSPEIAELRYWWASPVLHVKGSYSPA